MLLATLRRKVNGSLFIVYLDAPLHADEPTVSITKAPQGSNVIMDCSKTDLLGEINFQWTKQGGSLPSHVNSEVVSLILFTLL